MSSPAYVDQHRSYRNDWSRLSYVGQAAALYAAAGLPVFPLNPRTKRPYLRKPPDGPGGFYQATTDLRQIWHWWRQYPDAMIGLPMGPICDRFVLDPDGAEGEVSLAALLAGTGVTLPPTLTALTPRGRHLHLSWDAGHPVGCITYDRQRHDRWPWPHLDVKGSGGYVVLPPSIRSDGRAYRWADTRAAILPCPPELLIRLPLAAPPLLGLELEADPPSPLPSPSSRSSFVDHHLATRRRAYGEAALRRIADEMASTPEGARNTTLFKAACQLARLANGGCLDHADVHSALALAAARSGLDAREIEATIRSGFQVVGGESVGPRDASPGHAVSAAVVAARRAWLAELGRRRR